MYRYNISSNKRYSKRAKHSLLAAKVIIRLHVGKTVWFDDEQSSLLSRLTFLKAREKKNTCRAESASTSSRISKYGR